MISRTEQDRRSGQIEFISSHRPAVAPGEYTIQVEQALAITAPAPTAQRYRGKAQKFRIQAPANRLNPTHIRAVFPPEGSLGDHALTLPHIVLTPSTLPWERSGADPTNSEVPWLALILFTEEEYRKVIVPAGASGSTLNSPAPAPATIQVPAGLLRSVMPKQSDLKWLTHVRQAVDPSGKIEGVEVAVVMGHRLPAAGNSVVHLVALDGALTGEDFPPAAMSDDAEVQVVTLKSWRFASVDPKQGFVQLLKNLNQRGFKHDDSTHAIANEYLQGGASLLPHHMREGNKSASWYRGPLIPGHHLVGDEIQLPVRAADDLVRFNEALGLFDVSYAVAWELGRLLMLNNKGVALDLYHWKQTNTQKIKETERQIDHLPFDGPVADTALPSSVIRWFEKTALLEGIPFHNLVADEKLLPVESIRFFEVDWRWVECLLDGAFSIGRVTVPDHQRDRSLHAEHLNQPPRRMSGFIMRSDAVGGWPDLQAVGFDSNRPNLAAETETLFRVETTMLNDLFARASPSDGSSIVQIQQIFQENGLDLSDQATIDQRGWYITEGGNPIYELTQAANNDIDVRSLNETKAPQYIGRIDASFENDLEQSNRSKALQRAFGQIGIELPEELNVIGSRWFLTDGGAANYLVEHEQTGLEVYRDYRLPLLRFERLSKNVLIAIFEGKIQAVDFHLKPEMLHHGVHRGETDGYAKALRDENGREQRGNTVAVPLRDASLRIIDIPLLAGSLASSNEPSEFALQMVEGTPRVRFLVRTVD